MAFTFALGDSVRILASDEIGIVISRSESLVSEQQYQVRYKNGQGVAVEQWWSATALVEN